MERERKEAGHPNTRAESNPSLAAPRFSKCTALDQFHDSKTFATHFDPEPFIPPLVTGPWHFVSLLLTMHFFSMATG